MSNNVTYQVNLRVVGEDIIGSVTRELEQLEQTTQRTTKSFGDCFKSFLAFSQALEGLSSFRQDFENLLEPGRNLNANMIGAFCNYWCYRKWSESDRNGSKRNGEDLWDFCCG